MEMFSPLNLFYSYSHRDEEFRCELSICLASMRRQGIINEWYDRRITAGKEWSDDIKNHLDQSHIILFLVSKYFIDSDYCFCVEFEHAMRLHKDGKARAIPVICKPTFWQNTDLAFLKALPEDGKPISTWSNKDEALLNVVKGIYDVARELSSFDLPDILHLPIGMIKDGVETTSTKKCKYMVVILADYEESNQSLIRKLLDQLRIITKDNTLQVYETVAGSLKVYLVGTRSGYERLKSLHDIDNQENLLGYQINEICLLDRQLEEMWPKQPQYLHKTTSAWLQSPSDTKSEKKQVNDTDRQNEAFMYEVLISRLVTLTNALNDVNENQCRKILDGISKYLSVSLDAYFVDIFRKEITANGDILKHVGSNRETSHNDNLSILIHEKKQRGVIPWVYNNKRDLWIHDRRESDWEGSIVNQAAVDGAVFRTGRKNYTDQNEMTDNKVYPDPQMNSFSEETAGFIAVPIILDATIWGVMSLEFRTPKVYDRRILKDFVSISDLLALLFRKQEIDRHNDVTTIRAMNHFLDETSLNKVVLLAAEPTCFYVRPFKEDICQRAEKDVVKALKNVKVYHVNENANEVNLKDIQQHIKKAHIGIVDVTGFNANVMIELGMMIMQGMNPLLIRNGDNNEDEIPYDIERYTIQSYFEREGSFFCDKMDSPGQVPLQKVVYDFAKFNMIPPEYLINLEMVELSKLDLLNPYKGAGGR